MSELFLYIIIAIIWAIIGLISQAYKKQTKKQKSRRNRKSIKKYQNKKLENEEEIFRNLNKTLNSEKEINKVKVEKVNNEKINKKENKFYEMSYKDKEILKLQKKYDSIINDKNNLENIDLKNINFENLNLEKKTNNAIQYLSMRNAIIYNAILEPKRLNYRRKIKKES